MNTKPHLSVNRLSKYICAFGLLLALFMGISPVPPQSVQALQPQADFNADGYADLAVGTPYEDVSVMAAASEAPETIVTDAGSVIILPGDSGTLDSTESQYWWEALYGLDDYSEDDDLFGYAMAAGNFNGDGYMDLAIGVPGEDIPGSGANAGGAFHVLYGAYGGLSHVDSNWWHQGNLGETAEDGDQLGRAMTGGDFNGDGYDDLAVGAPFEDLEASGDTAAGIVHVLYGGVGGLSTSGVQTFSQDTPGVGGVADDDGNFGWALTSGDFNGDGRDELAIGAPGDDIGLSDIGSVTVLFGSGSGLVTDGNQLWFQGSVTLLEDEAETGDRFGAALASGNFNGDGWNDLAVGVPGEDFTDDEPSPTTWVDSGGVHIIFGTANGLDDLFDEFWNHSNLGMAYDHGDQVGYALAAGNFNAKDSPDDLAIGAPYNDISSAANAGSVNILTGTPGGLTLGVHSFWRQGIYDSGETPETGDQFGWSLAAGDFSGDGYGDLAIGAPFETIVHQSTTYSQAGAVTILHGSATTLLGSNEVWHRGDPNILNSIQDSAYFGYSLAALPYFDFRIYLPVVVK